MRTLSGRRPSQHEKEIVPFIELLKAKGVSSYIEIGARHGDTFYDVMKALGPGAYGIAVDLPGGLWGTSASQDALVNCVKQLHAEGINCDLVFGDSTQPEVIQQITDLARAASRTDARVDAILIDGDHTYAGVSADWRNYGGMARKFVAFHDIAGEGVRQRMTGHEVEVPRLWRELKAVIPSYEFIDPEQAARPMGIGVLEFGA